MPAFVILHACDTWLEQILNDVLTDSQTSVHSSRELRGTTRRAEAGLVIVQLPDDWNRIGSAIAEGAALSGGPDVPLMAIAPNADTCKAACGHGATRCVTLPLNVAGLLATITEMLAKTPLYQGISEPS